MEARARLRHVRVRVSRGQLRDAQHAECVACGRGEREQMIRRLGVASVALVLLAFGGASAGPARPLQSLRLIVSVVWLTAPDEVKRETRPLTSHVPQPAAT